MKCSLYSRCSYASHPIYFISALLDSVLIFICGLNQAENKPENGGLILRKQHFSVSDLLQSTVTNQSSSLSPPITVHVYSLRS